jgi:hypothetical protein
MMDELEALQDMADSVAGRFTAVFERHMWEPFIAAGLPADQVRPLTESLQRLSELAGAVTDVVLRDALRRKAGEFLAQQARHLDSVGVRDEIRPLARAAGLDLLHAPAGPALGGAPSWTWQHSMLSWAHIRSRPFTASARSHGP